MCTMAGQEAMAQAVLARGADPEAKDDVSDLVCETVLKATEVLTCLQLQKSCIPCSIMQRTRGGIVR